MNGANNGDNDVPKLKRQNAMTVMFVPDLRPVMQTELEKEIHDVVERLLVAEEKINFERGTKGKVNDPNMKDEVMRIVQKLLDL